MLALGDKGRVSSFGISMFIMFELLFVLERMAVGSCASSGKKCGIVVARDIEL